MPMIKRVIQHSCGHQEMHKIIKTDISKAEALAGWLATKVCRQCWLNDDRAKLNTSVEKLAGLSLAQLTGSDKQIGFATAKRRDYMLQLLRGPQWNLHYNSEINPVADAHEIVAKLAHITTSKWWIERGSLVAESNEDQFRRDVLSGKFDSVK